MLFITFGSLHSFSIGATVNNLLGLTWKQAICFFVIWLRSSLYYLNHPLTSRSPGHRVPWWVLI